MENTIEVSIRTICILIGSIYLLKFFQVLLIRRIDRRESKEIEKRKETYQNEMLDKKSKQAKSELENKKQLEDHLYNLRIKEIDKVEEYKQKARDYENKKDNSGK